MADKDDYVDFLLRLCDFAVERQLVILRDNVRSLLKLLPTGEGAGPGSGCGQLINYRNTYIINRY